jgi:hypothetical protein
MATEVVNPVPVLVQAPGRQAFRLLLVVYSITPLIAGLDKFFHVLVDWDLYLAPVLASVIPFDAATFMRLVGVLEVAVAVLVVLRPRIGGYVLASWLLAIILNLILVPGYFDIALRDFALALGAVALAKLAVEYHR